MLKRLGITIAILLAAFAPALVASSAHAAQYPPGGNGETASVQAVTPGGTVTFRAEIFRPGSRVVFRLFSTPVELGSAIADADGVATLTATIPANTPLGNHTVKASGIAPDGSPLTVSVPLVVANRVVNGVAVFDDVARTGSSNALPLARAGVATVAAGALLVVIARKRRSNTTVA